jgi:hypothetical protein
MGMTKNNNGSNYKLHEFLGSEDERQKLLLVYLEFFNRSRPLDFKYKTLSEQKTKYDEHFKYLIDQTKIFYVLQDNRFIGFISFDIGLKTLEIPKELEQIIKPQHTCEFVFAASRYFNWNLFQQSAFGIFQLIKAKYNVKYIAGNVRRKHKKRQFIAIAQKLFKFKTIEDFAYYEIP